MQGSICKAIAMMRPATVKKPWRGIAMATLCLLSACSATPPAPESPTEGFATLLLDNYRQFNRSEVEQGNQHLATIFAQKITMLQDEDTIPEPESPSSRTIPGELMQELLARRNLVKRYTNNAWQERSPSDAAGLQAYYDCMVVRAAKPESEFFRNCRAAFNESLLRLQRSEDGILLDEEARPIASPAHDPEAYAVHFPFDSAHISGDQNAILDQVSGLWAALPNATIIVSGHADRSGRYMYNLALGHKRAMAVRDALIKRDIPAEAILVRSEGESNPAILTENGESEARNRRVIITIQAVE